MNDSPPERPAPRMRRPAKKAPATERHRNVARRYFREGVPLDQAMEAEGFSPSYGRRGISAVAADSAPFAQAFQDELEAAIHEAESLNVSPDNLAKLVEWRLAVNIVRGRDEGAQSAKLAGNLKKLDLFVRHNDMPAAGIVISPQDAKIISDLAAALPSEETTAVPPPSAPSGEGEPK